MLLPGQWVEVRPAHEIASGLDARGRLEGLPFMPEMLRHCGRRFRVALRAERACAHPSPAPLRRMAGAVTLQGLRCDGAAHAGCQLGCMLLWKEAWLRPVDGPGAAQGQAAADEGAHALPVRDPSDPQRWACQATALPDATLPGEPLWHPGQYLRFVRVRTFDARGVVSMLARPALRWAGRRARALLPGPAARPLPSPELLNLNPGEWVQVKSPAEIAATLDARRTHQGLAFTGEMVEYCGRRMRVASRVERIIDESTGRLRTLRNTVLLEGCACDRYLGCARGMPLMWREAWLRRSREGGGGR